MDPVGLVIRAIIAICIFVIARWCIPALFALLGVNLPEPVVVAIALLVALALSFWPGWSGWRWPWQKSP